MSLYVTVLFHSVCQLTAIISLLISRCLMSFFSTNVGFKIIHTPTAELLGEKCAVRALPLNVLLTVVSYTTYFPT